jgi:lysophospholipase L1-like esterase
MRLRGVFLRILFLAQLIVLILLARQWAYVTTYRFYVDHALSGRQSAVTQRFDVDGRRVVPRIATRQAARVSFDAAVSTPATFHADIDPIAPVHYQISWNSGTRRQVLAAGVAAGRTAVARGLPASAGVVELSTDGPASWVDPRLVRNIHVGRHLFLLILLTMAFWLLHRGAEARDRDAMRLAWFKTTAFAITFAAAIVACEVALRALGDHAPAGVLALRHDLGEVVPDERWEDTARYGRRLRAGVSTENEWRYGDIVRMGFVSAAVSPGVRRRFAFKTDAEGFRNDAVRERVNIAALGDSFTDALTVPVEASWPMRLQQRRGVSVQNYGTAGFGPQQELLVLRDFVLRHRPSHVVLAYFAGNDLFDAERFDDFQQRGHAEADALGWPIKDVYDRADTWFVTSALSASASWLAGGQRPFVVSAATAEPPRDPAIAAHAPFDGGLFSLEVEGRLLQFAFMPPYLNTLNYPERELRARRGWRLTRDAILAMQHASRQAGADFTVMFLPFKSQVYWPLLERSVTADELHRALEFYLKDNGRPIDVDAMRRNRLSQNAMLRDLCKSAGIPFLDTTPMLQQHVELGENVYFPDESHLNEIGQRLVGDALADFLQDD